MRPRINPNLIGSSSNTSSSAKIAEYNRKKIFTTITEPKEIHYVTFFGKEYIIGKDISLEDVKKANMTIKTKII